MTDNTQWQSPGESAGASPAGSPIGASQPRAGWAPPPKPGLVPLRPLDLGTLLGAAFRVLRRNPRPTFGAALLVQGFVVIVTFGVIGVVSFLSLSRLATSSAQDYNQILAGSYGAIGLSAIVPVLLSLAASALLQGIIVLEVMRATLGEKATLRDLWSRARGRLGALVGWTLLVALAVVAVVLILGLLIALLVAALGATGVVLGILLGIFGGLGLTVVWVWLSTKLSLVPSVLMAERVTIRTAVARSWALTNRAFWKTFGIQLLVAAIIGIATQIITMPISFLGGIVVALVDPNGQSQSTSVIAVVVIYLLLGIVTVVFGAIGAVVQSATVALIYIDLRMRKEGLDLELARFVEARQSGAPGLTDPYTAKISSGRVPAQGDGAVPPTNDSPWT
ncbi:MAG: hypothetical protein ACYCZY_11560 [Lacisediminihabitans sp.]